MWKAPKRPNNEITQSYNDGVLTIYTVTDEGETGRMPQKKLTKKYSFRYSEQRVGITRFYEAKQNQIEIERTIRVPRAGVITNQDIAQDETGKFYGIDMIQSVKGVYPPSLDITLKKISQGVG